MIVSYFRPQLLPKASRFLLDKSQTPNARMSVRKSTSVSRVHDPRLDNLITGRPVNLDLEQNYKQDQNKVQRIILQLNDVCSRVLPNHFHFSPVYIKGCRINRGSVRGHCSVGFITSGREHQQARKRHAILFLLISAYRSETSSRYFHLKRVKHTYSSSLLCCFFTNLKQVIVFNVWNYAS